MAQESSIDSILLADCGTVMTKVVLLDRVGGQYRFVARGEALTTAEYPWSDVSAGVRHATEQITDVTGRDFFDTTGELLSAGQQGADVFVATTSASPPLQVVLGGLVRDLSVASAERAAAGGICDRSRGVAAPASEDRGVGRHDFRPIPWPVLCGIIFFARSDFSDWRISKCSTRLSSS